MSGLRLANSIFKGITVQASKRLKTDRIDCLNASKITFECPIVMSEITIDNLTVTNDVSVGGELSVNGNTSLTGNLDVNGDTSLTGNLDVNGNTTVVNIYISNANIDGNLEVKGDGEIEGNFKVESDTNLEGNVYIDGNTIITANLTVANDLIVDGTIEGENLSLVQPFTVTTFPFGNLDFVSIDNSEYHTVNNTITLNLEATLGTSALTSANGLMGYFTTNDIPYSLGNNFLNVFKAHPTPFSGIFHKMNVRVFAIFGTIFVVFYADSTGDFPASLSTFTLNWNPQFRFE